MLPPISLPLAITLVAALSAPPSRQPSLIVGPEDFAAVRRALPGDPVLGAWKAQLADEARRMLREPAIRVTSADGADFYHVRTAARRILTLAGLYRLEGNRAYAERARKELRAVVAWPTWSPKTFLLTAETTAAVAIGLDWLDDVLSPAEREAGLEAIAAKGLGPAEADYHSSRPAWSYKVNNWNQVCNAGMILGALAVARTQPALARAVLADARASLEHATQPLADGGGREGPEYWAYATNYSAYALAALERAGTRGAIDWFRPGLARTGWFRIHSTGPSGRVFNFGDADLEAWSAPSMLYLARRFNEPAFADAERRARVPATIFHLLWGASAPHGGKPPELAMAFPETGLAMIRGAWGDLATGWVGLRGGTTAWRHAHSHLDLGSFVFEADGVRWAEDLGRDDYALPGYFGDRRWAYYRLSTAGHNTLTFDGANQLVPARAPLMGLDTKPGAPRATLDLSEPYAAACRRATRAVALLDGRTLEVVDDLELARAAAVGWHMHTRADVTVDGPRATLRQDGRVLHARILAPEGARFRAVPVRVTPPELPLKGVTDLQITLQQPAGPMSLVVRLGR